VFRGGRFVLVGFLDLDELIDVVEEDLGQVRIELPAFFLFNKVHDSIQLPGRLVDAVLARASNTSDMAVIRPKMWMFSFSVPLGYPVPSHFS